MAKLFFDQVMEFLGVPSGDDNQPVQADDPLGTSDPQFGYRDYTPAERAQEVLYGSLDTAGSMLRGVAKAGIEAPRDIYALGSAIGKIQDRSRNRVEGQPVKTIGELFTEAYNEAPSFLPDETTAERKLSDFTPMSRTYSQDASVYNLPEEFGRIAAPLPLIDYARPAQIAKLGKTAEVTPRILSAVNPETGRTGFTSGGGTQIPALEPLREPTRMGGMNTLGNEDELRQARFNMQKLDRTPQQILDEVLNDPNAVNVVGEAERDAREMLGYGQFERLDDKEMQGVINMRNNLLVDRTRQFDRETLITPMSERQSVIATDRPRSPMPRILDDTPKVEKEPPMLRVPEQQARVFNEDGGTGTYSRVEQALLDLKNDSKVPASMTPRALKKRLEAKGVTDADMEEHGLNLTDYVRKNQHGHDVVDVQKVFDGIEPPQERMGRVILDETGGGDADEMDLLGRRNQGQLAFADIYDAEAQHRMEDWLYDYMGDIENDYNSLGRELSPNTFDRQSSQTDQILEAIVDRLKMTSQAQTDEEAVIMAYDKLNEAIDQGGAWLDDLDSELGGGIREKAEETIYSREQEFYNENPYIDDTIEFAGEDFAIFGNDDIGYSVHHNGTNIISDVYDLNELEVQIQNWAMDQGYFGHGTGQGAMQWSQYLQGDSDYYEPIEEVILTYDPKSGNTFESSHYGSDIAEGYVTHLRSTARETADGDSVYHVDEIQSDLHQTGRQTGYSTPEDKKELRQANADYQSAQEEADQIYAELRDDVSIPNINEIALKLSLNRRNLVTNMLREGRITPEEFDQRVQLIVLDEITDATDPVKLLRDEGINDPDLMRYAEARLAGREAYSNVRRLEQLGSAPSSDYPLKDERWIKAMVRQAMERAVAKGNFDGITFSNPQNQINQWSNRYEKLYNEVYENKLKSILETIGKEYGVKPRKVKLNDPEMQEAGENWYLPLSKDMIETIKKRGVPLASAVGVTPAILDRINKEREDKTPRILRTA